MDIFGITAVAYLLISIATLYFRPELIIGIQLFSTPIFGNAFDSLGIGIGSVYAIFALTVFSLIVNFARNEQVKVFPTSPMEIGFLLFIFWVATTLFYTPSPSYGTLKVLSLYIISFPCVYMARIYCDTPIKLRRAFRTTGWYAIFLLIYYTSYVALNYGDSIRIRSSFFGPLSLGYIIVSMVPFIFFVAAYSKTLSFRILAIGAIPCASFVALATGSRGPILALLIATCLSLLRVKYFIRIFAGFAVSILVAFVYISSAVQTDHKGLERILGETDAGSKSSQGRQDLFVFAIDQFKEFPLFGQGSGSYSYFVQYTDERLYPHNTYLEIAGELGLLGLLMFCTVLVLCIVRIQYLRLGSNNVYIHYYWAIASIQALFIIGIINSNLSFQMTGQRILYVSIGILAATTYWKKREINDHVYYIPVRRHNSPGQPANSDVK